MCKCFLYLKFLIKYIILIKDKIYLIINNNPQPQKLVVTDATEINYIFLVIYSPLHERILLHNPALKEYVKI